MVGATESSEWRDVCKFLSRTSNEQIIVQLRAFKPATLTPAVTRKIRSHMEYLTMKSVVASSAAAGDIYTWVRSVYAQASYDEASLSNYAFFSLKLIEKPYAALRRHQPAAVSVTAPWERDVS